jgi:hypothetical protein
MDMPQTEAAMRSHLIASPPDGHGMASADMPMPQMTAMHTTMHEGSAGHSHTSMKAMALKAEQLGTAKWRVLAIPFGGPLRGGKDLDGEYFSPRTDPKPSWFKERPALFHHGQDQMIGDEDVGIEGEITKEKDGWWADLWLDRSNRYFTMLDALMRAGKMFGSSGSMSHLVRKAADGEILVWPHVEQTLTLTPANVFSRITASKALDHFTSAGIALDPSMRDVLTEVPSDLGADLPQGGDDPAMARLASTLGQLDEVLRGLAR